jgi:aspartate/methionine/tyrosine aminotransferase
MEENGIKADYTPSGAFYMLVNTGVADSTDFCLKLLKEKHVAVAPGDTFGKNGAGYVRIALAQDMESVKEGVRRLCEQINDVNN